MKEQPMHRQNFLHGTAVLAAATAIVKILGMLYKIPLGNVIGDTGFGYFTTAYDIYSVLLMISTTGLPVAMSRMISESAALGNTVQIRRIFRVSMSVFLVIGVFGTVLMAAFCRGLSVLATGFDTSWAAILCLAPSVLLICIISALRGFFQGQSNMTPTSVSQVFEALCKLLVGLSAAAVIVRVTHDITLAAGGAILGVTGGCAVSVIYLWRQYRRALRGADFTLGEEKTASQTLKELLVIAVPITIGSAGLQMINLVDTMVFMRRLVGPSGFDQAQAESAKGIYNFCQSIFNLPCAFIPPITISIIPAITEHLTCGDRRGAAQVSDSATRLMGLVAAPCAVGLMALSGPILQLLRGYTGENLATGSAILAILGAAVLTNSLVLITNAVLQAHGQVTRPVVHMFVGGIVKVLLNYWLVGIPAINIKGAPIGTFCCYLVIAALNILSLRRLSGAHRLSPVRSLMKPLLASLGMGVSAYALCGWFVTVFPVRLSCIAAICCGAVIYLVLVVALRAVTYEDCLLLPKGEKIAKILKIHP